MQQPRKSSAHALSHQATSFVFGNPDSHLLDTLGVVDSLSGSMNKVEVIARQHSLSLSSFSLWQVSSTPPSIHSSSAFSSLLVYHQLYVTRALKTYLVGQHQRQLQSTIGGSISVSSTGDHGGGSERSTGDGEEHWCCV